jgi:hypothetical protein
MGVRIGISAAVAIACSVSAGNAEVLSCAGIPVTVSAPDLALAEQTCRAAARTVPLLAQCGVTLSQPQNIEVKDEIPGASNCMGIYHCGANKIEILSPGSLENLRHNDSAFYSIPTATYFGSIVAHELAHAAYDVVPCPYSDCLVTSEYVAYAMQVYSLPPLDQSAFEADLPLEDRVSRYEISAISLMMAPDQFARKVWAHFSQREDGCAYVADMMRANFYLDTERP